MGRADRAWTFLRPGAPVFAIGASLLVLNAAGPLLGLPSPAEFIALVTPLFQRFGLWAVAACYFVESLFVLSFYWPGSFIVFLAVATSHGDLASLVAIWIVINIAATLALALDVAIGHAGLHKLALRFWSRRQFARLVDLARRYGAFALFVTGFHVNWLSMTTVAFASLRSRSPALVLMAAATSHALWSVPLLVLFSAASPALSTPATSWVIVALFFGLGVFVCLLKSCQAMRP